ncbi:MAG TPA: heme-binding protein [Gammaproteobacteria bacterium]|nr:heme-binding protein [Gammaproteobacteria bacterium]
MFAREQFALALAAAMLVFGAATAHAQVDPKLVIGGKSAEAMGDAAIINGDTAEAISHACEKMAADHNEAAAIVVLDPFGNVVHEHRMDGAAHYVAIHTAEMKAHTAFLLRQPTSLRQNNVTRNPSRLPQEIEIGFFPVAGGLPIWAGKQIIGFVGVGGQRPTREWSDEICAWQALEQVVGPQPPLPKPPAK